MAVHFTAPHPIFGRVNSRLPIGYQQRSPYYWWWAYLRRNADYLACCDQAGAGDLADLYADFGDVRDDDFRRWWTEGSRGAHLFGERPLSVELGELATPAEWHSAWTASDVMVVAVPLRLSKRRMKGAFARLVDQLGDRHTGTRGRPAVAKQVTTARYRLARNYTIPNLQTTLLVYDDWLANQQSTAGKRLTLWELGVKHNLNKKAARLATSSLPDERLTGRNLLGATVSRYVRQAKLIVDGTARGVFPLV